MEILSIISKSIKSGNVHANCLLGFHEEFGHRSRVEILVPGNRLGVSTQNKVALKVTHRDGGRNKNQAGGPKVTLAKRARQSRRNNNK